MIGLPYAEEIVTMLRRFEATQNLRTSRHVLYFMLAERSKTIYRNSKNSEGKNTNENKNKYGQTECLYQYRELALLCSPAIKTESHKALKAKF